MWYLIEDFFYEMAYDRKKMEEKISGIAPELVMHYIKVLCFPKHESYIHWLREIESWMDSISLMHMKTKNGRFKLEKYFDLLYKEPVTKISDYTKLIRKKFGELPYTDEQIDKKLRIFVATFSEQFSKGEYDFEKIYELI